MSILLSCSSAGTASTNWNGKHIPILYVFPFLFSRFSMKPFPLSHYSLTPLFPAAFRKRS